jgi:nucleotide-binding universal stress UspA family protein
MKMLIFVMRLPYARPAVSFGGLVAQLTRSPVTLFHSVRSKRRLAAGEEILAQAKSLLSDVESATEICEGQAPECLLETIETGDYDLVVLQARRGPGLLERFKGTVGRAVASTAPISVLIVKREQPDLKRILACTGGREVSEPVIRVGGQLAQAAGARLTVLHVSPAFPGMYTGLETMEETLTELLQTRTPLSLHLHRAKEILDQYDLDVTLRLRHGDVTHEILDEAHTENHDLVLIGASAAKAGLKERILGDVTRQLVHAVQCPVWVVR